MVVMLVRPRQAAQPRHAGEPDHFAALLHFSAKSPPTLGLYFNCCIVTVRPDYYYNIRFSTVR